MEPVQLSIESSVEEVYSWLRLNGFQDVAETFCGKLFIKTFEKTFKFRAETAVELTKTLFKLTAKIDLQVEIIYITLIRYQSYSMHDFMSEFSRFLKLKMKKDCREIIKNQKMARN